MRPQAPGFAPAGNEATAQSLEDLGWNDMGEEDAAANHSAEVLQLTPAPHNPEAEAKTDKGSPKPKVRTMREELEARLAESGQDGSPAIPLRKHEALAAEVTRLVPAPKTPVRAEPPVERMSAAASRRAAFTLRLDANRHLKLRLASTVRNRSAQQLVTEALDRFLNDIPEIEALASQVQRD
jgi:hypothetical protein